MPDDEHIKLAREWLRYAREDLDGLRDLVPAGWNVKTDYPTLRPLAEWAIEARYFSELPDATSDDARNTTRQARAIYESVCADLIAHGFTP